MTVVLPIVGLFVLLLIGVPVAFSLGIAGAIGILLNTGWSAMTGVLQTSPHTSAAKFILTTIPMFILMAEFLLKGGLIKQLFNATYRWIGKIPGGLGIATVVASAILGALSGSSTASSATMAKSAIPEMQRFKYKDTLSAGTVAIAGTLALMIPPSIILIVYAILTETNIRLMLIAGIVPGILTAIGYIGTILVWLKIRPQDGPHTQSFTLKEKLESLKGITSILLLMAFVIAAIYIGFITPTEAGAVGALLALVLMLAKSKFNFHEMKSAIGSTLNTTSMIFTIIIGAMIFGYFLTASQVTQSIISYVGALPYPAFVIMGIIVLIYIILGTFMDQLAILFLTLPLTFPIAVSLGYEPIWFGIIVTKTVEIGLVTPPLGLNVYVTSSASKVPIKDTFKGVAWFLIFDLVLIIFMFIFPEMVMWLPDILK
jgi:C4-dicarboxylate transporter DctM subunit